jgi:hypothetical protein
MYSNLLENRNRSISELIKLSKCLGRSLRENVKLFSVDSENNAVTYITESNNLIEGNYLIGDSGTTLNNIVITSTDVIKNDAKYEQHVNSQIGTFIGDLLSDSHSEADVSFDKVLSLWENKLRLVEEEARLKKEAKRNRKNTAILESSEFYKLLEIAPTLVDFLAENKEYLVEISAILDSLFLSNVVSQAFDIPRITLESLENASEYTLKDGVTSSVFDIVCRQELLKQEIYESKREFDSMWVNNPNVQAIVSNIFEQEEEEIFRAVLEAVTEIPYFALATKKQLFNLFNNSISMNEGIQISESELTEYASTIFEINKPIKEGIVEALNDKYGINVKNLKDTPSFKTIIDNQAILFETLAEVSPEKSNLKVVLSEMVKMLNNKSGIESIDLNDFTYSLFETAGYEDVLQEKKITKHINVDFKKIVKDLGNLEDTFKTLKNNVGQQYDSNEGQGPEKAEKAPPAPAPEAPPEEAPPAEAEGENPAEVPPEEPSPAEEDKIAPSESPKNTDELNKNLQAMEDLISNLASEFGAKDMVSSKPDNGTDEEGSTKK